MTDSKRHFRVLAMAPNSWFGYWMNRQQLLSRLGRKYAVVYSDGLPAIWNLRVRDLFQRPFFGGLRAADNVSVDLPPKHLVRWPSKPRYDKSVLRAFGQRLNRHLESSPGDGPRILHLFHPRFADYLDFVDHDKLVYHSYDLLSESTGWNSRVEAQEMLLFERADLLIASSSPTADVLSQRSGREVVAIPNGVDFDAFSKTTQATPDDIDRIPHPRIGYVGHLTHKADLGLLVFLATERRDWQLVIIGSHVKLREDQLADLETLKNLENVHILGAKPREALPAYMHALDVGLLNYNVEGTWMRYAYPLKLHEYLACGLPIVSADLMAVREFSEVVWFPESHSEWLEKIAAAVDGAGPSNKDRRIAIASQNSWESRAAELERVFTELVQDVPG